MTPLVENLLCLTWSGWLMKKQFEKERILEWQQLLTCRLYAAKSSIEGGERQGRSQIQSRFGRQKEGRSKLPT